MRLNWPSSSEFVVYKTARQIVYNPQNNWWCDLPGKMYQNFVKKTINDQNPINNGGFLK